MGTITLPYTFVAGQTPTATNWNANPTTIATLVNGQIDKANVDSSSSDGIVTMDETQTISGAKTFSGAMINTGGVTIKDTDNAAGSIQTNLTLEWDPGDGAQMTDNSSGVGIDFKMPDASDNQTVFASLDVLCLDDSASSEDGEFSFKTVVNASEAEVLTLSGVAATFTIPVTVGVDDTGHDVKFFGATSGKYMLWDEDADSLLVSGDIDMVANGNRIDLDTDNDTSIRASADDTISIEVAGADDFTITANSLNVLTGSVIDLADNAPVQFGDADDASIKWDATNLAIAAGSADVKITASNVIPATNDGSALGVSGTAWSDLFLASGSVVDFHAGDVTLTHSANTLTVAGGTLATAALTAAGTVTVGVDDTGYDVKFFGAAAGAFSLWDEDQNRLEIRGATAAGAGTLRLSTGELTVENGDKLGQIDFVAPLEASGTDAILVGASIYAEADATCAADNNSTDLVFATGASEAADERMRITSDGAVTKPSNPAFLARNSVTDSNVTGDGTEVTIDFDTEVFDQGGDFASDTFTAPVTGRYQLNVSCEVAGVTSSHTIGQLQIKTSNRTIMADQNDTFQSAGSNGQCMYHGAFLADMDAGDTVTCTMTVHNGSQVVDIAAQNNTHFSGFLAS